MEVAVFKMRDVHVKNVMVGLIHSPMVGLRVPQTWCEYKEQKEGFIITLLPCRIQPALNCFSSMTSLCHAILLCSKLTMHQNLYKLS